MASIMNHTRAVRREDLAREAEDQADGNPARRRDDGVEDEEALAARAALDAYMKSTLGLQFDVPPPRPAPSKPAASFADKSKNKKKDSDEDEDDDSDESMDSSDDDETKDSKSKRKESKTQRTGGATEFAFRLFSGSGKAAATTQNPDATAPKSSADTAAAPAPIVLLDDGDGSELLGPGGLLNPPRPLSFYLAGEPTPEALEQYSQVTVSGEDIVKASRETRTWGWEVPWRARTVLKASSKAAMRALLTNALAPEAAAALPENLAVALASATNALPAWAASSQSPEPTNPLPLLRLLDDTAAVAATKHRRPGKRRRIILRKREQERREKAAKAAAQAQSKEEHLSEKKKRLNRIKKLRRREKKKAEKGGEGGGDGGDDSGDDSGGD